MLREVHLINGLHGFSLLTGFLAGALALYRIYLVIYNLYLHPLAKVPGPKLYAASNIPYSVGLCKGTIWFDIKRFHDQYGPVVRYAPNDVSFTTVDAWKEIYGHKKWNDPNFPKDRRLYREGKTDTASILVADDADHSRVRRLISHAFSEKALRGQEGIMQSYVSLLIRRLQAHATSSNPVVDMNKWYNFTTFDLIGDLAFGEPFGCLESEGYHPWVAMIFGGFRLSAFNQARKRFPWLMPATKYLLPSKLTQAQIEHFSLSFSKARQRAMGGFKYREDFMSYILRHNGEDGRGMTPDEIGENSNILIVAGSETTASLLTGTTYYLLKNPECLQLLTTEIRSTFEKEDDINLVSVGQLKYLLACLDEGLRLYPPVPSALGRDVPKGGHYIEGYFIPEQTTVAVVHWPTYHSERNFHLADEFRPDRWLGDPDFASDNKEVLQPFHVGPRNCLGKNLAYAEMRLILCRTLWNFDLELQSDSENWTDQLIFNFWQKGPLNVKLIPRSPGAKE